MSHPKTSLKGESPVAESPVAWPQPAKWIHMGLLLSVTFQMVTGLSGWWLGVFPFTWHIYGGPIGQDKKCVSLS